MILIISIISFLLDGILSVYLTGGIFFPLLTICSLVLIYPFFKGNDQRYYKYIMILGFLYDIAYFNTALYHVFIFLVLGFIISFLFYYLSIQWHINLLITVLTIIFYRVITYLLFIITNDLDINLLFESIYNSLALNIIYTIFIYLTSYYFSKKYKIVRK